MDSQLLTRIRDTGLACDFQNMSLEVFEAANAGVVPADDLATAKAVSDLLEKRGKADVLIHLVQGAPWDIRRAEFDKAIAFCERVAGVLGDVEPEEIAGALSHSLKEPTNQGPTHSARSFFWAQAALMIRDPGWTPKVVCDEYDP